MQMRLFKSRVMTHNNMFGDRTTGSILNAIGPILYAS